MSRWIKLFFSTILSLLKNNIGIVITVVVVLLALNDKQVLVMLIGFSAAIVLINWAFNTFLPSGIIRSKKKFTKKMMKKIF